MPCEDVEPDEFNETWAVSRRQRVSAVAPERTGRLLCPNCGTATWVTPAEVARLAASVRRTDATG
jgi:hypothetical protein